MAVGISCDKVPEAAKVLPIFDGFPYLITRVVPSLYHVIILPEHLSEDELIASGACQAILNQLQTCLVLGQDRCVYYGADGSPSASDQPPRGGILVYGKLAPFRTFPVTLDMIERHERLVAYSPKREGWITGDVTRGGRPATREEIDRLKGEQSGGVPVGLAPCPRCGAWRGECLDPVSMRHSKSAIVREEALGSGGERDPEEEPEPWLIPVSCLCENRNRCAACGRLLYRFKLNANYFNKSDGRVWHVPGFCGFSHRCAAAER